MPAFFAKCADSNEKLISVRETFDQFNLISGLHSFMSINDSNYENLLPPLILLSDEKKNELLLNLKRFDFIPEKKLRLLDEHSRKTI